MKQKMAESMMLKLALPTMKKRYPKCFIDFLWVCKFIWSFYCIALVLWLHTIHILFNSWGTGHKMALVIYKAYMYMYMRLWFNLQLLQLTFTFNPYMYVWYSTCKVLCPWLSTRHTMYKRLWFPLELLQLTFIFNPYMWYIQYINVAYINLFTETAKCC